MIALEHVHAKSKIHKEEMEVNGPNEKPIHYLSHELTTSQTNGPNIEKDGFVIFYALQKLDQYLHNSKCIIRTDHKPLQYIMDSPVQNKKIQNWTTNIHSYQCKIEYIEGKGYVCADMLSCLPHRSSDSNDDNEHSGPDITDTTLQVSMINGSNTNQYYHQITDNQCTKEELNLSGYDLAAEQTKEKELLKLKEELQSGNICQAINSKYILLHNVLYYLSKADPDPVIQLDIPEHLRKEVIELSNIMITMATWG